MYPCNRTRCERPDVLGIRDRDFGRSALLAYKKLFSIIAASFFLTACGTTPRSVDQVDSRKIVRAGVVSVLAHEFNWQYVGLTVFNNEYQTSNIQEWSLDADYEEHVRSALKKLKGIDAPDVTIPRHSFLKLYEYKTNSSINYFSHSWESISKPAMDLCSSSGLDHLFVIASNQARDSLGGTNQTLTGVGMYSRGLPPIGTKSFLYVSAKIALLDCRNGSLIALRDVSRRQSNLPINLPPSDPSLPFMTFHKTLSKKPFEQWSEQEKVIAQNALKDLPLAALWATVNAMIPNAK